MFEYAPQRILLEAYRTIQRIQRKKGTALASFPRSGNTWIRALIEHATGERSGSVYNDRIMPRGRYGVVIKTHELDSDRYVRAIHVLRNPFDCIESYFHWKRDIARAGIRWDEHVEREVVRWREHTRHWLDVTYPVYRLRYEELCADTLGRPRSILAWLGFEPPDARLRAAVEACRLEHARRSNNPFAGAFFRRGAAGEGIHRFTEGQRRLVIDTLRDLLKSCGYEGLLRVR